MEHLNSKIVELTWVTQEDIEHEESLESVLTKFNNFVFNSIVLKNKSYCIITHGHWELAYQLFIEISQKKINFSKIDLSTSADLGHYFYFVFDLRKEFLKDFPSHVSSIHKIDKLLDALKLKRNVDAIKTTKVSQGYYCQHLGQEGHWVYGCMGQWFQGIRDRTNQRDLTKRLLGSTLFLLPDGTTDYLLHSAH